MAKKRAKTKPDPPAFIVGFGAPPAVWSRSKIFLQRTAQESRLHHQSAPLTRSEERGGGINLPMHELLKSLPEDQSDRLIGIVLSGSGSDRMRGVPETTVRTAAQAGSEDGEIVRVVTLQHQP